MAVDAKGTFTPPAGVAVAAKRALEWIAEGLAGDGFTDVGRARAVQLASGSDISGETVNRMISFFARQEQSVKGATGFNSGEDGYPTAGRVAWDAWGGDAGQTWVNGLSSVSSVRAIGDKIGISDFDDTLNLSGELNGAVYSYIQEQGVQLYVVTGRSESDREATVALLDKFGVEYSRLVMKADELDDLALYKGKVAAELLADGLDVVYVVENDVQARAAYRSAGVENVLSPDDLLAVNGVRKMEDYTMTKGDLLSKVGELKLETLELIHHLSMTVEQLSELVESVSEPLEEVVVLDEAPADLSSGYMEDDSVRFVNPLKVAELHERGERVSKGIERRELVIDNLEIRAEGNGMTLRGYAAVFNAPSQPLPFIETIAPGAFRDSLNPAKRNDIKLLWNHDTGIVLGSTRAGTLRLIEDERGLFVEADLPETQAGKDAAISIQRGDVTAFSFGFRIPAGGDEWAGNDRLLKRVNLHEVSVGVAFPAYTATDGTANVRSVLELRDKIVKLAQLRGVSAEDLTDALLALEAGDELTQAQGELLTDTLGKVLKKDPEVTNPQALLDLKKKQLDLLMSRV